MERTLLLNMMGHMLGTAQPYHMNGLILMISLGIVALSRVDLYGLQSVPWYYESCGYLADAGLNSKVL